ncbi:MAG: non-reducing end alpha-L-arabinofuranosidase, partial [Streptomyces sp.]|nr:non-reducing end alpha-L-arabinofuranosidase [Streptomyces sp.]
TIITSLGGAIPYGKSPEMWTTLAAKFPGWMAGAGAAIQKFARTAWAVFLGATPLLTNVADFFAALSSSLPSAFSAATEPTAPFSSASCDVYVFYGTPCVAAYSTTRALSGFYDGPLYQVQRASDGDVQDIGLLAPGGNVDASQQDSFCFGTTCTITKLYDQSGLWNDLTIGPAGGQAGADQGAPASALPMKIGPNAAYGVYVNGQTGYRNDDTQGIATGPDPEGMYMVASGTHVNSGCCFDFGNAEISNLDKGAGHMDAVNLGTKCYTGSCTGTGPWVQADLEDGLFQGGNGTNLNNLGNKSNFVTAMLKNDGTTQYALKGADSQAGGLSSWYEGPLPTQPGYNPMQKEGAIILGIGGDNSNASVGSFFEGAMTDGYPSTQADDAVQAGIVAAGYSGSSGGAAAVAGQITSAGGKCVDVFGDDTGGAGAAVDLWDCLPGAKDQHWTRNTDGSVETLGLCLDTVGASIAQGTLVHLATCTGQGGTQKWVQQPNGSLLNPLSGYCLDDPDAVTTNGTQLRIWPCNGAPAQQFKLNGGTPVVGPGGKCLDVFGEDNGGDKAPVDLWDCQPTAIDQHWGLTSGGQLLSLGKCLDVAGDSTTAGALVQLYTCNGSGGQVWRQKRDKSLVNPQSGLCLDDPNGVTTNGTQVRIWPCNGAPAQQFPVYNASLWQPASPVTLAGGQCMDVSGDDTGVAGTAVDVWGCQAGAADQHWIRNSDGSLETLVLCLDTVGGSAAPGTGVVLAGCTGQGGTQKWVQQPDGSVLNPVSGLCLDDPNGTTANGTQLRIWPCNGAAAQKFAIGSGSPIANPSGQCLDVIGDDTGGDGSKVDLWSCQSFAVDQHWKWDSSTGQLKTLGKCLDIKGDSTVAGTPVQLYACNSGSGQVWRQMIDGSLINPVSGLCLDDPNGTTANGTQLRIWPCNGAAAQKFPIYDASLWQPAGSVMLGATACLDVAGNDTGGTGTAVDTWSCQPGAVDQHWSFNPKGTVQTLDDQCLTTAGGALTAGTQAVLAPCDPTKSDDVWTLQADDSLLLGATGPATAGGLCLDDPNGVTANGTQLRIWPCNGAPAQQFSFDGGAPIIAPGGLCLDVKGDDNGTDKTPVDAWGCQPWAADQHWFQNEVVGSLGTLGKCLDIAGDSTAAGTPVQVYTCDGNGGQVWQPTSDGTLLNPQSGLCLDDPGGAAGTQLVIEPCKPGPEQLFIWS